MPGSYAHYRFGAQLLPRLSPEVRRVVKRHRALYDLGVHGPDIFFYHNIGKSTDVVKLGYRYHRMPGSTVFTRAAKRLRLEPSEPGLAYLYGLLTHYCLDSCCHPFIHAHTDEGPIGHVQLETELDRRLLEQDGKTPPETQDCSRHMALTEEQCAVVAAFYPPVTPEEVQRSIKTLAWATRMLAVPKGKLRQQVKKLLGPKISQHMMPAVPDAACSHLIPELLELYDDAFRVYPTLEKQITAYLTCGVALGQEFDAIFG